MSDLAKKIHMRTVRRYIAWLLLTVIMITNVDTVSIMQAIGAEKSKNWDVEYYLTVGDDNDEGIPIPEEEGISTLQASASDTVHFNMFLSDLDSPDHKRFDETFTITMPEWLYQELTDSGSEPLALGETEAAECGYLLEEVMETADSKGTASNATAGNATVSSATASDADLDTRKVKLRFVEELRQAEDPEDIEIEEQWITLSFEVPFDTTVTSTQDGNDCEIGFTFAIASASNLLRSPFRSTNDIFLVEWTLTVDGTAIEEGKSVTIPAGTTVDFKYEVSIAAGKIPTVADCDDFEYTITLPKVLYDRMIAAGGKIIWPEESVGVPLFNEPIVPQESSADPDNYELVLTFSDATKARIAQGERFGGAKGYFEFTTEEKIDLSYEVNEDEDSTIITYQPTEEVKPSITVTKAIRSIFNETAYLGNAETTAVKSGDYVIYTITLTLRNGVVGESYEIPAGSIYESFHGGVYSYVDMTLPTTKTKFESILNASGYSVTDSQKKLITDLFVNPLANGRLAWETAAGTIPPDVPNSSNSNYKIMTNKNTHTLNTTSTTLNLYICLQVTDGIDEAAITTASLKNNVYFDDKYAVNPTSGVGPGKSKFYYDAALQIYPSTIWRVSDQATGAGIPIQIGSQYNYSGILSNKNGAVHPGDFVTFVVVPSMQGTATSYIKSIDVYLPLGFEPVTASNQLPSDYKFYYTAQSSATLYDKNNSSHRYFSAAPEETHVFNDPDFKHIDLGLYNNVRRYTFTWTDAAAETAPRLYFTCRVMNLDPILEGAGMDPDDSNDKEIGQRYCYLVSAEISKLLNEKREPLADVDDEDSWTDNDPFNDWYNYETKKLKNNLLYLDPKSVGEIDGTTSQHVLSRSGAYTSTLGPSRDEDDFDYTIVWLYDDEDDVKQGKVVLKEIVDTSASATTTQIKSMMAELAALNNPLDIYTDYALPVSGKVTQTQTIVPYCVTVNPEGVMQDMKGVKLVDTLPQSMEFLCTPSGDPVVAIYEVIESGGYRFPAVNEDDESITYIHPDYCKSYQVKKPLKQDYVVNSGIDYYKPKGITDGKWNSSVNAAKDKLTIDFGDIEDNCYQVFYFAIVDKVSDSYENGAVLTWNTNQTGNDNVVISYSDKGAVSHFYGKAVSLDGENYSSTAQLPADSEAATLYYRLHITMTTSNGTLSYGVGDLYFEDHIRELLGDGSKISVGDITFGDKDGVVNGNTQFEAEFDEQEQKLIITNKDDIIDSVDEYIFFQVTYDGISYGDVIRNTFGGSTTVVKTPLKLDLQKIDGDSEEGLADVEFKLTYSDGTAVKDGSGAAITLTTDKDGLDSVNFIPDSTKQGTDGTYTLYLTEVAAPAGYFGLGGKDDEPASGYVIKITVEEYATGQYSFQAAEADQESYYEISTGSANEIQVTAKNYKYPSTEVLFDIELAKKLLAYADGEELPVGNEYTFTVELYDGDTDEVTIPVATAANSISSSTKAAIKFQDITISKTGTYVFKVTENVPADYPEGHNADSYDPGAIYVTVTVEQGTRGLKVSAISYKKTLESDQEKYYDKDANIKHSTFINYKYPTTAAEVGFELAKKLLAYADDEELPVENEYTFTVELDDGDVDEVTIPVATAANSISGTSGSKVAAIRFQGITISKVGTYVFKVTENVPTTYPEGHNADSYDPGTIYVTVEVVQGTDGLVATVVSYEKVLVTDKEQYSDTQNPDSTFVNYKYPTTPTPVEIELTKKLLAYPGGGALAVENEYSFTVELFVDSTDVTISVATASNSTSASTEAKIKFQGITISKVGYYIFKVTENVPAAYPEGHNADSYDPGAILVGVKVVQGTEGLVVEEVVYLKIGQEKYSDALNKDTTFVNYKYPTTEALVKIDLTKKLLAAANGKELAVENEYTFTVELEEGEDTAVTIPVATVSNSTSASTEAEIQFQGITISKAGTYVFMVTENVPAAYPEGHNADSYDPGTVYVTVEIVQKDDGLAVAEVSYEKYLAEGKEKYYENNGLTPDSTFVNYKYPTTAAEVEIELTKKLLAAEDDEELAVENEYTFTVELDEGEDAAVTISVATASNSTSVNTEAGIQFQGITISKAGTYVFKVTENVPAAYPEGHNADSYDPGTIYVTVEVIQGADGLVAKVVSYEKALVTGKEKYSDDQNPGSTFVNYKYPTTETELEIELTKKLLAAADGEELPVENEYTFTVELDEGEDTAVTIPVATALNSASVSTEAGIKFQGITISKVGTYVFKVTENVPAAYPEGHIADSYDPGTVYVMVEVVQEADGLAVAEVTYEKYLAEGKEKYYDENGLTPGSTFVNYKYPTTEAELEIELTKKLLAATDGSELEVEYEYTFTLELMEGNEADVTMPVVTASNASGSTAATIQFGDIQFRKVGTYVFKVTEDHPLTYPAGHNGASYDPGTIEVMVTVVQGINGLEVEDISYKKDLAAGKEQYYDEDALNPDGTFVNFWYPAAEIDIDLTKKLLASADGRELPVEQEYTFTLKLKEGNGADVEIPDSTAVTDGSGSTAAQIQFKDIKIWNPGTYVFEITEKHPGTYPAGHNSNSYDPGTIQVTVTLERQDGFLVVTGRSYDKNLPADKEQYYDEDAEDRNSTFINFLNPEDDPSLASVKMQAQKSLVGRTMAGNDFSFEAALIYSSPTADIKKVTAANDANGKVVFPVLDFDQEGTYIFSISEQTGNAADIVYDKNIYYAKVIAERDRFGTMHCTLSYGSSYNGTTNEISGQIEMPAFVNTVRGYLNIRKVSWSSGTSLSGAEFELLYRNKGSEDAWIGYGGTLVTAGSGGSLNLELPEKYWNYEYKLTETKAPSGYSNSRVGTILFTMLQNGTIDTWSSNGTAGYVELSADNITLIIKNHTTGGGGGGGGTTPVTPTTPTNPEAPTTPTTPATPDLPPVTPGHNIVPNGDSSYYEVDENGVALGRWYQDEDGTWIFDEMVPLAGLARAGEQNTQWLLILMLMSGLGGAALVYKRRKDEEA